MRGKVIFISVLTYDVTWKMVQRPGATRSSSGLERENLEKNGRYTCSSWIWKIEEEENERTFEQSIHPALLHDVKLLLLLISLPRISWKKCAKLNRKRKGTAKEARQKAYRMWKKAKEENRTKGEVDYSFANCCILLLREIVIKRSQSICQITSSWNGR